MLKGVNDSRRRQGTGAAAEGHSGEDQPDPVQQVAGLGLPMLDWEQIENFADFINANGYASPIRTPRGQDILAACGQLKSASERMKKTERLAYEAMMIAGHGE
jgi:23S rRNA (adenine2503-C2)-methyltransferase